MAPQPSRPLKRHRITRSADLAEFDLHERSEMDQDLERFKTKLQEEHMLWEELQPITESIQNVLSKLRVLDEYIQREENKGIKVTAISFSKLEEAHLKKLGVIEKSPVKVKDVMPVISKTLSADPMHASINMFWNENGPRLTERMKHIEQTTSMKTEAGRRILIDCMIQVVTHYLTSVVMHAFIFPELRLSVATDNPVLIDYIDNSGAKSQQYRTFLTGSVDYLAFTHDFSQAMLGEVEELLSQTTSQSVFDVIKRAKLQEFAASSSVRLLHIEAKRGELLGHKPQVIGESLATTDDSFRSTRGLWCLTSGYDWIFGLTTEQHAGTEERISYSLETMKITNFVSPTVQDDLKNIFMMMVYCVSDHAQTSNFSHKKLICLRVSKLGSTPETIHKTFSNLVTKKH
ncbi:hypothetical protein AMATHDRAFT_51052 [Amanita thiersii Skay4041]|uniref:Uncharacterized protein n=1 Tax=Amanita thiersii Skay4041 TaxID=703135 RepID=A0A2A9N837_9AGAR|nr:hypothetical protein AMATHDRAFT_51052 [Amanita thiersii Skay4041]